LDTLRLGSVFLWVDCSLPLDEIRNALASLWKFNPPSAK